MTSYTCIVDFCQRGSPAGHACTYSVRTFALNLAGCLMQVFVAAVTAILEPYVIAFTLPGLYEYNSATSILEYLCIALILADICISFNVARYVNGELVTSRRLLARNYMRLIFWVDLVSIFPFDEVALVIAGLNGPNYVLNPVKAQYLSLLKLIRMVSVNPHRSVKLFPLFGLSLCLPTCCLSSLCPACLLSGCRVMATTAPVLKGVKPTVCCRYGCTD